MDYGDLLRGFSDMDIMVPILFSIFTGALIGGERELQGKDAGLRTHMLVCLASCLLTVLGLRMSEWVAFLPEGTQIVSDMSRMPHAIITGVGFLGAGVIFRNGPSVHGLTTAASLWLTAALGITFGTDMIELGLVGLTGTIFILLVMRLFQRSRAHTRHLKIDVTSALHAPLAFDSLQKVLVEHDMKIISSAMTSDIAQEQHRVSILATTTSPRLDWQEVMNTLGQHPSVTSIAIVPTDVGSLG